jgi:predicted DNA-binding transcriptional regulator AlpA
LETAEGAAFAIFVVSAAAAFFLTVRHLEVLGVSRSTLYRRVMQGEGK